MALVRYLSTGDFFKSYLAGAREQAEALGVDLQVFDSRQDAERQGEMPHARSYPVTLWSRGELYFGGLRVGPKIATLNA